METKTRARFGSEVWKMKESNFVPEVQGQAKAFSSLLARSVGEFFKDEENRKKFEDWYLKKNGKPYQWVPVYETRKVDK